MGLKDNISNVSKTLIDLQERLNRKDTSRRLDDKIQRQIQEFARVSNNQNEAIIQLQDMVTDQRNQISEFQIKTNSENKILNLTMDVNKINARLDEIYNNPEYGPIE